MKNAHSEPDASAAPRYALAWAMLACAIAALLLAYPALTGGFLVNPRSDQYIAGYSFREFGAESLRSQGQFPLWNPYLFGGMPYIDAMHGDIFYPTFLLRMILPTDVAMTWGMILHFWTAGVAAYAFFRANRLSFHASLIGGLAYMMSGQVAGLVSPGHDGKLFITALFPITLLVLRMGMRDGKRWAWGVLSLIVGLAILTPHPQLLQYLLLASGAYALWMAFFEGGDDAPNRAVATRRLFTSLGAIALGLAIGAIQFLPLKQYTPWSPRSDGHTWEKAVSYSMPPEETINWVLPEFSGMLDKYWGTNGIHLHSEYLGFPVLLLAAIAFATAAGPRRRLMWFATGMLALSWIWSMGGFTPAYKLIAAIVPGTMYFRAPSTMMFETAFAVALLAALGVQRIMEGKLSNRFIVGGGIALGVLTVLGISGVLTSVVRNVVESRIRNPELIDANAAAVSAGAVRMFVFGAGAIVLIAATLAGKMARNVGLAAIAALIVADLWTVERKYWLFSPPGPEIFADDAITERIKNDSIQGRVFAMQLTEDAAYRDPYLGGDAFMALGVRNVGGYHGNELHRYQTFFESVVMRASTATELLQNLLSPSIGRLTNLRWFYTNTGEIPPPFEKVLGPVRNAVGTNVWLYKIPGDYRQAWVVPAIIKAEDDQTLPTIVQSDVSNSVAIFEPTAAVEAANLNNVLPQPLTLQARVVRYAPGEIDIELDAPAPDKSALLVSENFYPGWTATVDGNPATVSRSNYMIMGVPLTAGAKRIEMRFTDAAYETGKLITLIALALSALLAIGGFALERKQASA